MAQATEETAAAGGRARRDEEEPRQPKGEPGHGPQRLHATAADHEARSGARGGAQVIAKAAEILKSTSSGAVGQTYSLARLSLGLGMRRMRSLLARRFWCW